MISLVLAVAVLQMQSYREPDPLITEVIDAPMAPLVSVSPDSSVWLLRTIVRNPPIAALAMPELGLAGIRFNPSTAASSRTSVSSGLMLMGYPGGDTINVSGMPADLMVKSFSWSPDGSMAAFTQETPEGVELWLIRVRDATAVRLTEPIVSLVAEAYPAWVCSGDALICTVIPGQRGDHPEPDAVPLGPVVQETTGVPSPVRTQQDLLGSPYDEELFQYHLTTQLARVGLDGAMETIGEPRMILDFSPSPDGSFLLVTTVERPFPYSVTAGRFPGGTEVWDMAGRPVLVVESHGVRDGVPITTGSVVTGRRSVSWREDADAELIWAEALDGGDAGAPAQLRDRVFAMEAPFSGEPRVLAEFENRFSGIYWCDDTLAVAYEWWWPTRNVRAFRLRPGVAGAAPELLLDYSFEDSYNDPGSPMTVRDGRGRTVLFRRDGCLFFVGEGASPEGDRPFLDLLRLAGGERTRLFTSSPPFYEFPVRFLDRDGTLLLIRRESASHYPNYHVLDLLTGQDDQVTMFPHPYPWFTGMHKEIVTYTRADGLLLSATLYLPPGYSTGDGPLPLLMWAYPREFISPDAAGQVSGSPFSFDYLGWWSPVVWLLRGYAVLDDPAMPIVGSGGEPPNENYIPQLVMNAEAAVNAVVEMGVADRDRIAVGGHSYGAFMTANLLAHTDLFAAGLARTGAYNRTLTPFGFQSEDRSLWEAPEAYISMSPFLHADRITEPLLLVHGAADRNTGTFPMQSERMFAALNGLGGTARLVMLPLEDHSYRARESILHVMWETQEWLDRYLKGEPVPAPCR